MNDSLSVKVAESLQNLLNKDSDYLLLKRPGFFDNAGQRAAFYEIEYDIEVLFGGDDI